MMIVRPMKVDSSTPKVMTFDPRSTPEPNASPILTKTLSKTFAKSTLVEESNNSDLVPHLNLNSQGSEKSTNRTYVKSSVQSGTGQSEDALQSKGSYDMKSSQMQVIKVLSQFMIN